MRIDPSELLLVRACLANEASFETSYREWEQHADLDSMNHGAVRLLPFLSHRCDMLGIEGELGQRLRGIRRYFWAQQRHQQHSIGKTLLDTLEGESVFALKGAAVSDLVYEHPELRPYDDIDLLVSRDDFSMISENLKSEGWRYSSPLPESSVIYLHHAKQFKLRGAELDLHWTVLPFTPDPEFDNRVMESSQQQLSWTPGVKIPSGTYCLIHTVIHGIRSNDVSPIRWIVDTHQLILNSEIDWGLFQKEVRALGVEGPVGVAADWFNGLAGFDALFPPIRKDGFSFGRATDALARKAYFSHGLWVGRLLRMMGSQIPLVRNALSKEGKLSEAQILKTWVRANKDEIQGIMRRYGIIKSMLGHWSRER